MFKSIHSKVKFLIRGAHQSLATLIISSLFTFSFASTSDTLGSIGKYQGQNTATGLYTGIYDFLILAGLILVAFGLFSWRQAHKRGESLAPAIGEIVIGILLTSIVAFIDMGSATAFQGTNSSELSKLQSS